MPSPALAATPALRHVTVAGVARPSFGRSPDRFAALCTLLAQPDAQAMLAGHSVDLARDVPEPAHLERFVVVIAPRGREGRVVLADADTRADLMDLRAFVAEAGGRTLGWFDLDGAAFTRAGDV